MARTDVDEAWTESEIGVIAAAARSNAAVRSLKVDLFDVPTVGEANVMARIVRHFPHLQAVSICDRDRSQGPHPVAGTTHRVDALLRGIVAGHSNVGTLQLYFGCSPDAFREFVERFPNLERLDIEGRGPIDLTRGDPGYDDFVSAVSLEMRTGKIPSLRHVGIGSSVGAASLSSLLDAARRSPTTIETIRFSVEMRSSGILADLYRFCARDEGPDTLQKVVVETVWLNEEGGLLDISPLFPAEGTSAPLAPNIQEVTFYECHAPRNDRGWLDRAASALRNVQRLRWVMSTVPLGDLLDRLPQLRQISCLFRDERESAEMSDEFDVFDGPPAFSYPLDTNDALARFCQVLERPTCVLDDVELDVIERPTLAEDDDGGAFTADESRPFPAIANLLQHSKGRLVANFGNLSRSSSVHVATGAARLGIQLRELRVRFSLCHIGDDHYAALIRALTPNPSLKVFELGFDAFADLGTPETSIDAMRDLVRENRTLDELVLRGLGSEAAFAVLERILPSLATTNRSLRKLEIYCATVTNQPAFLGARRIDVWPSDVWPRIRDALRAALKTNGVLR
jgi:hypothetical protein